jgi:hypothetical protein
VNHLSTINQHPFTHRVSRVYLRQCTSYNLFCKVVQKAYGNEALNRSNVFRWYSRFRDERELVGDDERDGRPKSTRTEVNIAAVADLVTNDLESHVCQFLTPQKCYNPISPPPPGTLQIYLRQTLFCSPS